MASCATPELMYAAVQGKLKSLPANRSILTNFALATDRLTTFVSDKFSELTGKTPNQLFTVRDGRLDSILGRAEVFESADTLRAELQRLEFNTRDSSFLVDQFFGRNGFLQSYKDLVASAKNQTQELKFINEPLNLLAETTAEGTSLPNNVVFGMMLGAYSWVSTAEANPFAQKNALAMLVYGDPQHNVTDKDVELAGKIGYHMPTVVEQVGNEVASMLNLAPRSGEQYEHLYEGMVAALGLMAIEVANTTNKGRILDVSNFNVEQHYSEETEQSDRILSGFYSSIRLKPEEDKAKSFAEIIQTRFSNLSGKIADLLGYDMDFDAISQRPIKAVKRTIRRSPFRIPEATEKLISKLQSRPWSTTNSAQLFDTLLADGAGYQMLLELEGWTDISETQLYMPADLKARIEAKNESVKRDVDNLIKYRDAGLLQNFYLRYRSMVQGRLMQVGAINPQNSKAHRHYVAPAESKYTVNKQNMGFFKTAVVQWFDLSPDKMGSVEQVFNAFADLYADANVQRALDQLDANDTPGFVATVRQLALNPDSPYKSNWAIVDALYALQAYRAADGGRKEFESTLLVEADGITNGYAISLLQFSPQLNDSLVRHLNQTGTYTEAGADHSDVGGKPSEDIYTEIGVAIRDNLVNAEFHLNAATGYKTVTSKLKLGTKSAQDAYKANIDRKVKALSKFMPDLLKPRNLAKQPFMIFNYGAGIAKIVAEMKDTARINMQQQLVDLQVRYKSTTDVEERREVRREVFETLAAIQEVFGKRNENDIDLNQPLTEEQRQTVNTAMLQLLNSGKLAISYRLPTGEKARKFDQLFYVSKNSSKEFGTPPGIVATAVESAMQEVVGGATSVRNSVVGALDIVNRVFIAEYRRQLDALKTELGRKPTNAEVLNMVRDNPVLYSLYPKISNQNTSEDSMVDLGKWGTVQGDTSRKIEVQLSGNKTRSHNPSSISPRQMAMHAIVRMVQNLDSQIMNTVLDRYPNSLNIYDALLTSPNSINGAMARYGKSYLELGLDPELGVVKQTEELFTFAVNYLNQNPELKKTVTELAANDRELEEGALELSAETLEAEIENITAEIGLFANNVESVRTELRGNDELKSQQLFLPSATEGAHTDFMANDSAVEDAVVSATPAINAAFTNPTTDKILSAYADILNTTKQEAAFWYTDVKSRVEGQAPADINAALKEALVEEVKANVELQNIKKSLDVPNQNNAEYYSRKDIAVDLQGLFDDMVKQGQGQYPSAEAESSHVAHLQEVLTKLLGPVAALNTTSLQVNSTDKFTNGGFDPVNSHITVNVNTNVAFTYAEQSAAEVFVHEGLHGVAKNILANNPAIRRQLERLQRQLGRTATYEIFMAKDANGNVIAKQDMAAEIRHAKKMFEYVFGANNNADQIEEFFVYGLTHPGMIEFAQNNNVQTEKGEVSALRKLLDILDSVLEAFRRIIGKAKTDRSVHQELFSIAESMAAIQAKAHTRQGAIKRAESYAFKNLAKSNQYIVTKAQAWMKKAYKPISPRNSQFTAAGKLSLNIIIQHFSDMHRNNKYYERLALQADIASNGLIKEFGEGALDARATRRLLEKKRMVEANREHTIVEVHDALNKSFLSTEKLTKQNKKSITKALLKTDLSALLGVQGITPAIAFDMLVNKQARTQLEAQLRQQLGVNAKSILDNAARDLANFMTSGKSKTAMLRLNASELARVHANTNDADFVANLDALISLYALDASSDVDLQDAHAIAQREMAINPDRNGMSYTLMSHVMHKEETQAKLFYGNPTLMQKGYIQQIHPSLMSGKAAPMSEEKALSKQGFKLAYPLGNIPGVPTSVKYGYFVNNNSADPGKTTGMYALEDTKSSGTKLSEILGRQPAYQTKEGLPDNKEIRKFIAKYTADQEKAMKGNQVQSLTMIPLLNDKGKVVDFRIHMDHSSLENDMQQDLAFDNIIARQQGNGVAKYNSTRENIATTNFLLEYADANRNRRNEKLWVNIFDPAVKEQTFDMLPTQTQNYIRRVAGRNANGYEFYVSKNMQDSVFGFANMSVQDARVAQGIPGAQYLAGFVESVWQAVVSNAVSKIVIGLPEVVYSNIHSNFFSMVVKGIPPSYLIKKMREGTAEILEFKENSRRAIKLNNIIKAYKLPDTSPEARELSNLKKSLANNRVTYMVNAGMFTTIAEDYDPTVDNGYVGRIASKWENSSLAKRVPETVQNIGGWLYGSKTSAPFKVMEQVVQISDFVSRYALMEYRIREQGMSTEAAFKEAMDTFVNYNQPMSKVLTYLNSIGGLMFVKFFMRANRVGYRMIRENPLHLTTAYGLGETTGIETVGIFGDTIYGGRFMPQIAPIGNITENAFDFSGANALGINPFDN